MRPHIDVDRVLRKLAKPLLRSEVEAALEVAYLSMAADRSLRDEEVQAFERMAEHVLSHAQQEDGDPYRTGGTSAQEKVSGQRINDLFDLFTASLDREGAAVRLGRAAEHLRRPTARDMAYQLAFLMTISDFDTNDAEAKFEERTRRALGLSEDWAEALVDDVLGFVDALED